MALEGTVLEVSSISCTVDTQEGLYECAARGRLKESDIEERSPLVVGDRVRIEKTGQNEGVVLERFDRETRLCRTHPSDPRTRHVIIANVDQLLIVSSVREPDLSVGIIDRYVIAALYGDLTPLICINKIDLAENSSEYLNIVQIYRDLDYEVVCTSAETGEGIEQLKDLFRDKSTVLAGHSGVGKSSLINKIQPGLNLKTAPIGWKGTHCTSSIRLIKLDIGGYVADTPGVRELDPWDIEKYEVQQFYPEIWERAPGCRMPDCSHVHEPDCAVQKAVEEGEIPQLRYDSYLGILESIERETEPRRTDVDRPSRQVKKEKREPSRRTRKQELQERFEEEIENWRRQREENQ
ncbi:MAG: ribosome small subunit-dependent GTPase A [Candidatus Brocadiia bacterium]